MQKISLGTGLMTGALLSSFYRGASTGGAYEQWALNPFHWFMMLLGLAFVMMGCTDKIVAALQEQN